MAQKSISIIIPAFNEEIRLKDSLDKLTDYLKSSPYETEVILVDDGSTDSTVSVAEKFKARIKNFEVLKLPHHGKGSAINAGFRQAKNDVVVFTDADFSTPIDELPKLLEVIGSGADIAVGSRALDRKLVKKHQNFFRESIGKLSNILIRILAVKGIYDTQCGFKAFKKSSTEKIFERQTINGFAFDIELLFLAQRAGLKIKEVPVLWFNDPRSKVRTGIDSIKSLMDVFKIRLRHSHDGPELSDHAFRLAHRHKTYVQFFLVGTTSTLLDYSIYLTLTRVFNFNPLQANPFGVELAIIWSFTFNNLWTFSSRATGKHVFQRFLGFQFVSLGALMLSQMQILLFIHLFHLNDLIAKVLTIPVGGLFNYTINSRWTFKEIGHSVGLSRIYPVLIITMFVIYLILVKQLTGSFSILLPR